MHFYTVMLKTLSVLMFTVFFKEGINSKVEDSTLIHFYFPSHFVSEYYVNNVIMNLLATLMANSVIAIALLS